MKGVDTIRLKRYRYYKVRLRGKLFYTSSETFFVSPLFFSRYSAFILPLYCAHLPSLFFQLLAFLFTAHICIPYSSSFYLSSLLRTFAFLILPASSFPLYCAHLPSLFFQLLSFIFTAHICLPYSSSF